MVPCHIAVELRAIQSTLAIITKSPVHEDDRKLFAAGTPKMCGRKMRDQTSKGKLKRHERLQKYETE